jgi:hypothetical protein
MVSSGFSNAVTIRMNWGKLTPNSACVTTRSCSGAGASAWLLTATFLR